MQFSLEQIAQSQEPEQNLESLEKPVSNHGRFYNWAVDTGTMISFSFPIFFANEAYVAGMDFKDAMKSRGLALIMSAIFGTPYRKFRDYVFKLTKTTKESGFWKKTAVDSVTSILFNTPLYAGQLAVCGADAKEIAIASTAATLASGFLGRPYGAYLHFTRNLAGLKTAEDENGTEKQKGDLI